MLTYRSLNNINKITLLKSIFGKACLICLHYLVILTVLPADFSINGTFKEYTALNDGHINSTYVISFDDKAIP